LTYFDTVSKTDNGLLAKTFLCSVIGSVCDEGHFRCHDWFKSPVKCIKESVVCNGYDNCEDKSDEDKEFRSLVLCVCFVNHCLTFCTFSFGHCVVLYDIRILITPFGIFKLFCITYNKLYTILSSTQHVVLYTR
jgi:hypothetical protein